MSDIEVRNAPERSRYEAFVDGELAGFAEYTLSSRVITFKHTEVDPAFEGMGVGSTLVSASLDQVRAEGERQVRLLCPFYKAYVERHDEYADLVYTSGAASAR